MVKLDVDIKQSLTEIDESDWDLLGEADYPFTRHAFLIALEQNDCLIEFGWQPVYILLRDNSKILAAICSYIKNNSYGELVFDHNWAEAYQRLGKHYYPKLVSAIPYTPATGPRFLIHREIKDESLAQQLKVELLRVIKQFCQHNDLSGWHLLFERESIAKSLSTEQLLYRYDCQFHWRNQEYNDFDDFLSRLNSRKRKNIRKERASVAAESELVIEQRYGNDLSSDEWEKVHQLYAGIFDRKYGTPTLSADFFKQVGKNLKHRVLVVLVRKQQNIIAASVFFISDSTLFGRVWGCEEYYNHLHFECCYYQGIEFCIKHGLQTFDPGAQGEHKISRGFLPTKTCSAHWLVDEEFHLMIEHYLKQEEQYILQHCAALGAKSPYRKDA